MTAPRKRGPRPLSQLLSDHSEAEQAAKPADGTASASSATPTTAWARPSVPSFAASGRSKAQLGGPQIGARPKTPSGPSAADVATAQSARVDIASGSADPGADPAFTSRLDVGADPATPTPSGPAVAPAPGSSTISSRPDGDVASTPLSSTPTGRARSNAISGGRSPLAPDTGPADTGPAAPARPAVTTPPMSALSTATQQQASFKKMQGVLRDYQAEADPAQKLLKADVLLGLCESYLDTYGAGAMMVDTRQAWVEDAYAEARRARSQALAQAQYLSDAYGQSAPRARTPVTPNPAMKKQPKQKAGLLDTNLKKQDPRDKNSVIAGAQALGSGATGGAPGATDAALALMKKYGLTEAEILAVRTYTAADYKYINPAAANSAGWMAGSKAKRDADGNITEAVSGEDMEQFFEEGSLHAGVAMMGLQKLPPVATTVYRGARMTPKEFADADYFKGAAYNAFTSTSTDEAAALNFANGLECTDPKKTISVMLELHVTNARDIRDLSLVRSEAELLLLPGAQLTTVAKGSPDDYKLKPGNPDRVKGNPTATEWYRFEMNQTK